LTSNDAISKGVDLNIGPTKFENPKLLKERIIKPKENPEVSPSKT
jgi:hypothetical protein